MSILDDEIILKVENAEKNLRAIIDITAGEIYQAVEDGDNKTRGYIDTKADEIIAQVDDMAQELTGLINVQAGAVTALVEGGGAAGQMSLSLNLPVMIDATTRAKLVNASTEAKVAAVYAIIDGTEYYGIKGNASDQAVKALWDDAVAGNLIASQIVLNADQINLAGKTIFTSQKTASLANAAQSNAEATAATLANAAQSNAEATAAADATAKANAAQSNAEATAAADATEKANAAQSAAEATAAADATEKANAAQSNAEATAAADATEKANAAQSAAEATATSQRNEMATKLGYASYDAMVTAAEKGKTIIDGGYLRTALIDVENILTKNIMVKDKGVLHSDNFDGTVDANGNITGYGSAGWAIDHAGHAMFNSLFANGNCVFKGGIGEPTAIYTNEWELSPNGVYLIFCYKGQEKKSVQIPSYKGYVCASDVSFYLFSGKLTATFVSGKVYRDGTGYLYKIREQSSVCTAALIHESSTSAFEENDYDYLKVTFASSESPLGDMYNVVTVLKIGNI